MIEDWVKLQIPKKKTKHLTVRKSLLPSEDEPENGFMGSIGHKLRLCWSLHPVISFGPFFSFVSLRIAATRVLGSANGLQISGYGQDISIHSTFWGTFSGSNNTVFLAPTQSVGNAVPLLVTTTALSNFYSVPKGLYKFHPRHL